MVSELEPNRPGDARKLECVRWWVDVRLAVSRGGLRLGRHPQSSYRRSPPGKRAIGGLRGPGWRRR